MDILRFLTAGSVDDGKSTLIGRLLYDRQQIFSDQLELLRRQSKARDGSELDLALLTDGLRAERAQGITIDVAYKYFSTPKRKFIIADAPGHVQYTRNMVTAASTAQAVIFLIDARKGVIEQTRRHLYIAAMMGIRHFIFAINKMDLVGYSEAVYQSICLQCRQAVEGAQGPVPLLIPVAALPGDLVTGPSANMPWYHGPSILQALEELPVVQDIPPGETCFHVQYVNRPQSANLHDFRGYMGSLLSGEIIVGQQVQVFPSQQVARVKSIRMEGVARERTLGTGIYTIELEEELDITRGDYLLRSEESGEGNTEFTAQLCWFSEKAGRAGMKVKLQQNSMLTRAVITGILHSVNLDDYSHNAAPEQINLNDLVSVRIRTQQPMPRGEDSNTASLKQAILIDEVSNQTIAAVLID